MLIVTILLTLLIAALSAWLPGRLCRRGVTRADLWAGPGVVLGVWAWAACIYQKPGLTAGFDAFRLLGIAGMALWGCAVVLGLRLHGRLPRGRGLAAAGVLLTAALGLEVFVCNLNFWATHNYTPVDLRPYLTQDADPDAPLTLDGEHTALTFAGLDQELYNLRLDGLTYQYDGPHPEVQDPLFTLTVAATDEASSVSRQSWPWQVAVRSARSLVRSLDLSGKASTLTLTAAAYQGEYRQYPLCYTLQTVWANVPRPLDFSLVRCAALFALLGAAFALRPSGALWRDAYLEHARRYRPAVALVMAVLAGFVFCAPFADRFNAGVATSFYNTADWDGVSRLTFTKHIDEAASDTAAQYGALAHSLLQGRLDLVKDPPAAMQQMANPYDTAARQAAAPDALWDVAYYQGRYYVYFGVVPCLLFQLPFEALTGVPDLPPSLPMIALGWLLILASFGCVKQALRRWFPRASTAAYLLAGAGIAAGSQVFYLLLRPSTYEYAILCGMALAMAGLWQWLAAANTPVQRRAPLLAHLALGSVCMALVAGCRPQMELFAVLALPIFWQRCVAEKRLCSRAGAGEALAFALPFVLVAAGLMWYNAARFGSPFDFGANYNLTSNDMTRRGFAAGRIAPALVTFFFGVPALSTVFPYLGAARMATHYMGLTITELFYGGVFACLPLLWAFAGAPLLRGRLRAKRDLRVLVLLPLALAVGLAVLDCQMAGVLYRYQSDWLCPLLWAAALLWLLGEQTLQHHAGQPGVARLQAALRTALPLAVLAGAAYNVCVYFAAEPGLLGQAPALYQNVSRLVQFWL